MTTTTFSCAPDNTSDTTFRAWVSALITALTTVGLVQTADTGQINTATVTRPTAANTAAGYAIFRFNDTLQATRPLFIKLEFGTDLNTTPANGTPRIWLTVGRSTDGAGNVGGILLARVAPGYNLAVSASSSSVRTTGLTGYASAGEGWAALLPWCGLFDAGGYTVMPWFTLERTNDGDGIAVALPQTWATSGVNSHLASDTSSNYIAAVPRLLVITYATGATTWGTIPVTVPYTVAGAALAGSTALAAGSVGPVFPWVTLAPGLAPYQLVDALSYPGGDAPAAPFAATINGVTRTYLPIPLDDNHNAFGLALRPADPASTTFVFSRYVGLAIRWE